MKKLLCRIGLHKWQSIGYNSILNPIPVEQCQRCGRGQQLHYTGATFVWTKEEMEAAKTAIQPEGKQ